MDRLVAGTGDVFALKTEQELITGALEAGDSREDIVAALKRNLEARLVVFLDDL